MLDAAYKIPKAVPIRSSSTYKGNEGHIAVPFKLEKKKKYSNIQRLKNIVYKKHVLFLLVSESNQHKRW